VLAERHNGPIPSHPVIPLQSTSVLWVRNTYPIHRRQSLATSGYRIGSSAQDTSNSTSNSTSNPAKEQIKTLSRVGTNPRRIFASL
jgi:hypothetical protein